MIDVNELSMALPAFDEMVNEPLYLVLSVGSATLIFILIMLKFAFYSMNRADKKSQDIIKTVSRKNRR